MISIIICSRATDISTVLKQNIAETIGCDYELVVIDNSNNNYSIFQAYNEGVRRSRGDVLCFIHDDVLLHTKGWGNVIEKQLNDDSIGLIGVAGSHFMSDFPMYWWLSPFISQYNWENEGGKTKKIIVDSFFDGDLADVSVVDGLFLCMPKSLFSVLKFDEETYSGFHAYDMDISMQVQSIGKRVCVTKGLIIEHFWSVRQLKNENYTALLKKNIGLFYEKWRNSLPMVRGIKDSTMIAYCINSLYLEAKEVDSIRQSRAYRLGKIIIKPLSWVKNVLGRES